MVARAATGPDDSTQVSIPPPLAIAHQILPALVEPAGRDLKGTRASRPLCRIVRAGRPRVQGNHDADNDETLHPLFCAEIGGVDTGAPMDDATFAEIRAALDEYSVLVFHDQSLDDERQIAFSRRFGPLETAGKANPATGTPFRPAVQPRHRAPAR